MRRLKKLGLLRFIALCLIFASCKKDEIVTGITEIDNTYKFSQKLVDTDSTGVRYNYFELYLTKTLDDSLYSIGIEEKGSYKLRAHGWAYRKSRIGDWHYEKIYQNEKVVIDSIINYVSICDNNPRNTVKKFKDNKLNKTKGYFYEVDMKKDIRVGDTLIINLNFVYDTLAYQKVARELYIFKPPSYHNICNASQFVLDSFPIVDNQARMRLLMSEEDKGKNLYLGYYYLLPKKQPDPNSKTVLQVFTEIQFEVK